jgi:hypothetical protein
MDPRSRTLPPMLPRHHWPRARPSLAASCLAVALFGSGPLRADAPLSLGEAFTVNTVTKGSQAFPAVAMNAAGAAVVVWRCEDPDLSPGICARRFGSTGAPLGPELRVNTFTAGVQAAPDVAIDESGRFVVVWESNEQDGDQYGVYAQSFDAAGKRVGDEQRVNITTAGRQRRPAVAMAYDGRFVVVWESTDKDGSQEAVVLRRYGPDGAPLSGEEVVNTETQGQQWIAAVAMAAEGSFVVAWETVAYPTGGGSDIAARHYGEDGQPRGDEFLVNTTTQHIQGAPSVAIAPNGRFAIAWESFGQDGSDHGIYAQRFNAAGNPVGDERQINTFTQGIQNQPSVALAASSVAVVVWHDAERRMIVARCLGADGQLIGDEVPVDDTFPSLPAVAADEQGDIVIAWQDTGPEISARLGRLGDSCPGGEFALCLDQNRFEVEVAWRDPSGKSGSGHARPLTADSGYYWFFDDANVELVIKVLDACVVNGRTWVFLAGLTDVEVEVVVTHSASGAARVYFNPLGTPFRLVRDTDAFALCGAASRRSASTLAAAERDFFDQVWSLVAPATTCAAGPETLCLGDSRFQVRATYRTDAGQSGNAGAVRVTDDTGYFWFFEQDNTEILIKGLEGCPINGHFWVFAAGLTDVEVELTVTDTVGGGSQVYRNPLGQAFELVRDIEAFECP